MKSILVLNPNGGAIPPLLAHPTVIAVNSPDVLGFAREAINADLATLVAVDSGSNPITAIVAVCEDDEIDVGDKVQLDTAIYSKVP